MTTLNNACRRLRGHVIIVAALAVGLASAADAAELKAPQTPFSADMTMQAGEVGMTGKLWYDGGRERREMTMQGQSMVVLVRPDENAVFMLSDEQKTAMQMALTPELRYFNEAALATLNPEAVGRETVAGEPTNKYRLDGVSLVGERMEGHMWMTDDFIVVKVEGRAQIQGQWQDVSMTLANVKRGPVEPALFELPPGYQVMKMN